MSDITVMTHFVKKQKCREFEDRLHGIVGAAAEFKGYQGINILKPMDERNEYTTTVRFNEKEDRERIPRFVYSLNAAIPSSHSPTNRQGI